MCVFVYVPVLVPQQTTTWLVLSQKQLPIQWLLMISIKMDQDSHMVGSPCVFYISHYLSAIYRLYPLVVKHCNVTCKSMSGWWFGTFFIFPYIGNNHPNWLIFFRGVQTTNQMLIVQLRTGTFYFSRGFLDFFPPWLDFPMILPYDSNSLSLAPADDLKVWSSHPSTSCPWADSMVRKGNFWLQKRDVV